MKRLTLPPAFAAWLPLAWAITILSGMIYLGVQQNYRQTVNDPQIQIAEDTAAGLQRGQTPGEMVASSLVDPAISLAPFTIVFDANGGVLASSAQLSGHVPVPPVGVFRDYQSQERFTWQPHTGVRIAAIIQRYQVHGTPGYVLVGRSMRVVEERVDQLTGNIAIAWLVALLGSLVLTYALQSQKD